jgi:hypothetical protein
VSRTGAAAVPRTPGQALSAVTRGHRQRRIRRTMAAERVASDECGHDSARVRPDRAGRGGNERRGLRPSWDPAAGRRRRRRRGTRTSAMPKPSTITTRGRLRPTAAGEAIRRRSLFNPKENSCICRFSADAGSGIALRNSWLIVPCLCGSRLASRSSRRSTSNSAMTKDRGGMTLDRYKFDN